MRIFLILLLMTSTCWAEMRFGERFVGIVDVEDKEICGEFSAPTTNLDGEVVAVKTCQMTYKKEQQEYGQLLWAKPDKATPFNPNRTPYVRLQFTDGTSYRWSEPVLEDAEKALEAFKDISDGDERWIKE